MRRLIAACALAWTGAACFSPSPGDCAYTCVSNGEACPRGLECTDGWCRPPGAAGACAQTEVDAATLIDAGIDAALADAASICDATFGTAPGYVLCAEYGGTCEFYSTTGADLTCDDLCGSFGEDCVASYDSDSPDCEEVSGNEGCVAIHAHQICVCTKP